MKPHIRGWIIGLVAFSLGIAGTVVLSPVVEVWLDPNIDQFTDIVDRDFDPDRPFELTLQEEDRRGKRYALSDAMNSSAERSAMLRYEFPSTLIPINNRRDQYIVEGFSTQPVIVTSVTPVSLVTEPVASGTFIEIPSGSQGGTELAHLEVDLTSRTTSDGDGHDLLTMPSPISIDENTRLLLDIVTINPPEGLTSWVLELGYLAPDDSRGVVYLDRFGLVHDSDDISTDSRFSITSQAAQYYSAYSPGQTTNILERQPDDWSPSD